MKNHGQGICMDWGLQWGDMGKQNQKQGDHLEKQLKAELRESFPQAGKVGWGRSFLKTDKF